MLKHRILMFTTRGAEVQGLKVLAWGPESLKSVTTLGSSPRGFTACIAKLVSFIANSKQHISFDNAHKEDFFLSGNIFAVFITSFTSTTQILPLFKKILSFY